MTRHISTIIFIIFSLCLFVQTQHIAHRRGSNLTSEHHNSRAHNGGKPRVLEFDQGKVSFRGLETTTPTTTTTLTPLQFTNHTNNSALTVKFSDEYIQRADLVDKQTDLAIFLFTNLTGFCQDCDEFVPFNCEEKDCNAEVDYDLDLFSHNYYSDGGVYISQSVSLDSWNLATPAYFFKKNSRSVQDVNLDGCSQGYIQDSTTYGFIGLGVSGDAYKNFGGEHPIFSFQVNTSGKGQLIFGENKTLYDSTRTPMKISTNGNWTVQTTNLTWGPNITHSEFPSRLVFDLQFPGIAIPEKFYENIMSTLFDVYSLSRNKGVEDDYSYVYRGKISKLPNIEIGFTETEKIVLPPSAYTRKLAEDTYLLTVSLTYPVTDPLRGESVDFTILGWPVLSQFYTVFEAQDEKTQTVTLHPTYAIVKDDVDPTPSSFPLMAKIGLGVLALIVVICVVAKCKSKQDANKLQDELGNFYEGQTNYTRASNERDL